MLLLGYGRLSVREVMRYAIGYARDGYPVLPGVTAGITSLAQVFRQHGPSPAEIYLGDGVPVPLGFFLSTRAMFTLTPSLPTTPAPGKRPCRCRELGCGP